MNIKTEDFPMTSGILQRTLIAIIHDTILPSWCHPQCVKYQERNLRKKTSSKHSQTRRSKPNFTDQHHFNRLSILLFTDLALREGRHFLISTLLQLKALIDHEDCVHPLNSNITVFDSAQPSSFGCRVSSGQLLSNDSQSDIPVTTPRTTEEKLSEDKEDSMEKPDEAVKDISEAKSSNETTARSSKKKKKKHRHESLPPAVVDVSGGDQTADTKTDSKQPGSLPISNSACIPGEKSPRRTESGWSEVQSSHKKPTAVKRKLPQLPPLSVPEKKSTPNAQEQLKLTERSQQNERERGETQMSELKLTERSHRDEPKQGEEQSSEMSSLPEIRLEENEKDKQESKPKVNDDLKITPFSDGEAGGNGQQELPSKLQEDRGKGTSIVEGSTNSTRYLSDTTDEDSKLLVAPPAEEDTDRNHYDETTGAEKSLSSPTGKTNSLRVSAWVWGCNVRKHLFHFGKIDKLERSSDFLLFFFALAEDVAISCHPSLWFRCN